MNETVYSNETLDSDIQLTGYISLLVLPCHTLGGLSIRNILSHSSGGWMFEIKVSARLFSPEGCEGKCGLYLFSSSWWSSGNI